METLGDYRGAAMVAGVILAVAVAVIIALRLRPKRPPPGPAVPPPGKGSADPSYLDSSHIINGPVLPGEEPAVRESGEAPPADAAAPGGAAEGRR